MSAARDELLLEVATLVNDPGVVVMPYSKIIVPTKPTIMARLDEVKATANYNANREYVFALILVVGKTDIGPADDELDNLLEDLLHVVDKSRKLIWNTASRATFNESYPAYEVPVSMFVTIEDE